MIQCVVVAGGGTGGHLFPGVAVVEELRRRFPTVKVLFIGTNRGIEARVLLTLGERLQLLDVQPLKGRSVFDAISNATRLPAVCLEARRILQTERPDVVLGVGGYASGPVLMAAAWLGIPTALLEQNARVGLTNRMLASVVGRAYLTFPQTASRFRARAVRLSGNPIRRQFVEAARRAAADPEGFEARATRVLVLGGSQGARVLNTVVPEALAQTAKERPVAVLHQTGAAMRDEVAARYAAAGVEADVVAFIDDMARAYASAAMVIARAGATSVAELCAMGRASILIPYPQAADDHQAVNARALETAGAAVMIRQNELSAPRLAAEALSILSDAERRGSMGAAARRLGKPEAAAHVVDDMCEWLRVIEPGLGRVWRRQGSAGADAGRGATGSGLPRRIPRLVLESYLPAE